MQRYVNYLALALAGPVALLFGCDGGDQPRATETIRLATTTSTENSGLLDVLLPAFQKRTGIAVQVMPMGTGRALRTARDGNADVVLVHAPAAEKAFVAAGWGTARTPVMYNEFVLLGPPDDPAHIRGMKQAAAAMKTIAAAQATFVSRGDNSGTHQKEQAIWGAAGIEPAGDWYRSVGKGMGQTLIVADEMQAYVLADGGTFQKFRRKISLVSLLAAGDPILHNPYSVIPVNPAKHPHVKADAAGRFTAFLAGDEARRIIAGYRIEGEPAFHP